jgi:hydrogenase maturation protease
MRRPTPAAVEAGVGTSLGDRLDRVLAGCVCVLGVGNRDRADDAAGSLVARALAPRVGATVLDAGGVPENYLEKVARAGPDTVLVVDALDFGAPAGECTVMAARAVAGAGLSSHALSLDVAAEYLEARCGASVMLLGIQPRRIVDGGAPSPEVEAAIRRVVEALAERLG